MPGAPGAPGIPGVPGLLSVAFIPALTVSIRTPVERAGEYGDTREAKDGRGSGGTGSLRPPNFLLGWAAAIGDLDFVLPLFDDGTLAGVDEGDALTTEVEVE